MKSCLKASSLPGSPDLRNSGHCRKCVVFNAEGSEEVYWADEWDRTPTEPATKLSYQEILELKEIQQSLPHAAQPADLRPGKQLLSTVPIALLPLAAVEISSPPLSPPPQSPSNGTAYQTPFIMPPGRARAPPPTRLASASLTHLRPPAPAAPRVKPAFAFLPLLSPAPVAPSAPSVSQPIPIPNSASSTNTAPDPGSYFPTYPPARAADDGEPDRVLPARPRGIKVPGASNQHPAHGYEAAYRAAEAAAYSPPFGSSAYDYTRDRHNMMGDHTRAHASVNVSVGFSVNDNKASASTGASPSASSSAATEFGGMKKKKKSFMLINDIEVEIEEDDDEEVEPERAQPLATSSPAARPMEVEDVPPPISPIDVISPPIAVESEEKTPSPPPISTEKQAQAQAQISPRLSARPLSPVTARPVSPLTSTRPVSPLASTPPASASPIAGRFSPLQARASSRLVRA